MKLGLSLFGTSPQHFATLAKRAEEVGFDSVWIPEHLVFPAEMPATYPYSESGLPPVRPGAPLYDPWVTLAFVAHATERIRLGTSVYILPLRHPLVTARAVTTLDVLSGGRTILGIGVGWLEEEFALAEQRFDRRGARTDEILEILAKLFSEKLIEHHGEFYDLAPLRFEPKPVQQPSPPVVVGGESRLALRRAAERGDGWIASGSQSLEQLGETIRELHRLRAEAGRGDEPFEIVAHNHLELGPEALEVHRKLGVTTLTLMPVIKPGERLTVESILAFIDSCAQLAAADQPSRE